MAKLTISIALAIAVANVAAAARAQAPAVRKDVPSATPNPVANQQSVWDEGPSKAAPEKPPTTTAGKAEGSPGRSVTDASLTNPATLAPAAPPAASEGDGARTWVGTAPENQVSTHEALPRYGMPVATGELPAPATSEPSRTYDYRFTATLDLANVIWRSGSGYKLFADTDRAWRIGLGFGYDLVTLSDHLVLAIEAGYLAEPAHGTNPGPTGGGLTGSLSASTLLLGGSVRWAITPWLAPYGHLDLLASRIAMDIDAQAIEGGSSGASWSHHEWTEGALLGVGVMMNMLPQTRAAVGLLVEGGLWLQRSVEMRLDRDLPTGAISTAGANVGTLENSGPYVRLAGVLRF